MLTLTQAQIIRLIYDDREMMDVLRTVKSLDLPDWYVCAGFIRNKVWDHIHQNASKTLPTDIDVLIFDPIDKDAGMKTEDKLKQLKPGLSWEVGNQAFAHEENNDAPYENSFDALSKLPETVTAIGVKTRNGSIELACPHGIDDLVGCIIRPTPIFYEFPDRRQIIIERLHKKKLFGKWPKLRVII